ncbi:uncharacterized protein LOC142627859 [Castanea sativa]|uniref:uncharacterized protein LOC142627859 n=1 Tax=Castanea sativa TaxID=21020 RepID=UPI003F64D532
MGSWTVSNNHYITESEHNKFIWLKQRKFIWIMHVPHARFSDKLNCCNLLTALFGSDSQDLMVQNCGYGLVYQQNVGELVQTLVQCTTMFSDNSDLIHQFTTHQSRTKKQSHDDDNVEGETSGTGRSNGTLRVPHYQEKVRATCYQKFIDARGPIHYCHRREHSEEFHLHYPYDHCFPPTKIPEFFSHYASGSSMTI